MKNIYCDGCKSETGKIRTKRGFVCWTCYEVELKIFNKQDWRDIKIQEYAKNNDMILRDGETKTNLANRCKRIAFTEMKEMGLNNE